MKRTPLTILLLMVTIVRVTALAQTKPAPASALDKDREEVAQQQEMAAQLEEIAMCHHAIKAAYHEALHFGQNPYYRYVIEYMGSGHNIYPIPQRCKSIATDWIVAYTKLGDKDKADWDKTVFNGISMTIPDMATDVQFLTVVINKMLIEGDKANSWENEDKDIPKP